MSKRSTFRRTGSASKRDIARADDGFVVGLLEGVKRRCADNYWSKGQSRIVREPLSFWWSALVRSAAGDRSEIESGKLTTAHMCSSKEVVQYTSGCSQRNGTVCLEPDHRRSQVLVNRCLAMWGSRKGKFYAH